MADLLKSRAFAALALAALAAAPAVAGKPKVDAGKMLDSLQECETIAEPLTRLACFDGRIVALKEARRADTDFLTRKTAEKFEPLNSTAISVAELQPGFWLLVLADHSVWRTEESIDFFPSAGDSVRISKGALGSYLANIGKQHAVRVRPMR